ncbi:MAG: hypothetical protein KDK70_41995 [Myxococcales bacterium]|nr:hypothetical protein [Myxococcales bacterium]
MPRTISVFLLPLLLALACSVEPRERPIPTDSSTWRTDPEFQKAVDALPSADKKLLQGWMMRYSFEAGSGKAIPARTVGEAVEEQRTYMAERSEKKAAGEPKAEPPKTEPEAAEPEAVEPAP